MRFEQLLFNEKEWVCVGDAKAVSVCKRDGAVWNNPFFCINSLHPTKDFYRKTLKGRRADINIKTFRNFMFEMDSIPLDKQLKILEISEIPWTTIVYSGSKSYHAILSLDNPLCFEPHKQESVNNYKLIWKRIQAYIDSIALDNDFLLPKNKKSFIDPTSQNPSRLSRIAGFNRNGIEQKLVLLGKRMKLSDFYNFLDKCPVIPIPIKREFNETEITENIEIFQKKASMGLHLMLTNPGKWAAPEGMYPILFKLCLWAIDETGCTKDFILGFMEKYTFPKLIEVGYPKNKLTKPIDHAYILKGD